MPPHPVTPSDARQPGSDSRPVPGHSGAANAPGRHPIWIVRIDRGVGLFYADSALIGAICTLNADRIRRDTQDQLMAATRSIVQELHQIQKRCGYLPRVELEALARRSRKMPLHRIHEVASFFPHFLLEPPKAVEVKVCRDMSCHLRGAADLRTNVESLAEELGAGEIAVEGVSCLGQCDGAPALLIGDHAYRGATIDK